MIGDIDDLIQELESEIQELEIENEELRQQLDVNDGEDERKFNMFVETLEEIERDGGPYGTQKQLCQYLLNLLWKLGLLEHKPIFKEDGQWKI